MKISKIQKLLEYNRTGGKITTISGKGGKKAAGKNFDNIAAGQTNPYKTKEYDTKYMKMYPSLSTLVKHFRENNEHTQHLINGLALQELQKLAQNFRFKTDSDGNYILPFGDNIRLKKVGNNLFMFSSKVEEKNNEITDKKLTELDIPLI